MLGLRRVALSDVVWVVSGKREIAAFLIESGADVNAKDNRMLLPIHFATMQYPRLFQSDTLADRLFLEAFDAGCKAAFLFAARRRRATRQRQSSSRARAPTFNIARFRCRATKKMMARRASAHEGRRHNHTEYRQGAFVCEKMSAVECAMKAGFSTIAKEIEEAAQQHLVMNGDL